jgi:putative FmdB family regulatory protein
VPVYEYECDSCHFRFEEKQGFNDEPLETCPRCQGHVRRVFHPAPIIFKGSGFYVTDNRKGSNIESDIAKEDTPGKMPAKKEPEEKEK